MALVNALVIDDDQFVRSTLTAGLANFNIQVIEAVASASQALSAIRNSSIEVAIVDLDLGPGPSGIDICNSLRREVPNIGLVILTSYHDPRVFDPLGPSLPKGCRFISKSDLTDFRLLVDAVLAARAKPLASLRQTSKTSSLLTSTQMDVLKLIAQGLSSAEIAKARNVSVKAVEGTISKIQKSIGIKKNKSFNQRVQLARAYFSLSGKKPPGA